MSRTEKFLYNSVTTAFYQIVVMIAGFITPRIMLKYYGSERCELTAKSIDKVLETISSAVPAWKSLIDSSLLSKGMKKKYLELLEMRLHNLRIV